MKEPDAEESALVAAAKNGSTAAFEQIVLRHQGAVRAYIAHFVRAWELIDDLAQETFLGAFKGLGGYTQEAPLRLWLLGVARRRVLAFLREELRSRRRSSRLTHELQAAIVEAVQGDEGADRLAERDRRSQALLRCVEGLPAPSAVLFTGFYRTREPVSALARRLGRSEGAIRVALHRLRQALRSCVERRLSATAE